MGSSQSFLKSRSAARRATAGFLFLACSGVFFSCSAAAQDPGTAEIPDAKHLAAALADSDSRTDTLLTLAAVARLLEYGAGMNEGQVAEFVARFRDDRAWLDRLAARFTELPMRPTLLDPAAWFLTRELDRQGLTNEPQFSPLGPDSASLLRQLFDRGDEMLAATLLPEFAPAMEMQSTILWSRLREQTSANPAMEAVVASLNADYFDPWLAAEPPAPATRRATGDNVGEAIETLGALAGNAMGAGPPDALRLKRMRFDLLTALPGLAEADARDARYLLALGSGFDGLYRGAFLAFTETLLWIASDMLLADPSRPETPSRIPRMLTELLPAISNTYAADLSGVDPRLNTSLAAVFDAMQDLQSAAPKPARVKSLRREIADAVAQLVLLTPDMDYYFEQPVRERITRDINACMGLMADRSFGGQPMLTREQFDDCMDKLTTLANEQANRAELAGDPDGPFGAEQLRRELMLTPWQRVNYVLGYLHARHPTGCEMPAQPLPNPLEWSSLVTLIVWFAKQSPVYFQTPGNEARILDLRRRGMELKQSWVRQVDCISGAGNGLNDPVTLGIGDYRQALLGLVAALREAEVEFRASHLKEGSDIVLHGDSLQHTAFRSDDLAIGPCDAGRTCEMTGALPATRALIGLFPDTYLIADQSGLGQIEICYDSVQWVNRRAEPVRADDPNVANYFGQLSFDLVGRYHENGGTRDIFGFNFVSPSEYHYLFAAADGEVLEDSCPVGRVGSRVVSSFGSGQGLRIVPDRLTYLAAARKLPSQVISANWSRNEEWRDTFVTGLGVTPREYPVDATINDRVNQHLQALYQAEQAMLYGAMIRPGSNPGSGAAGSLFEHLEAVTAGKDLLTSYMNLFYPQLLVDASDIRAHLEGQGSLLDRSVVRRSREANIAVSSINQTSIARLEQFQALWNRQPEMVRRSGTCAISVAHAVTRLNALYDEFFALPPRAAGRGGDTVSPPGDRPDG